MVPMPIGMSDWYYALLARSPHTSEEFGWITEANGTGIDRPGSGYSQI